MTGHDSHTFLEASVARHRKERKGIRIRKRLKTVFLTYMVMYTEKPKESTGRLLECDSVRR